MDQVAAQKLGGATRFASIELGCEDGRVVGNCDSGYSCAYSNSISWRTATHAESTRDQSARGVRALVCGPGARRESSQPRQGASVTGRAFSITFSADTNKLKGTLGPTDGRKIDEYLYGRPRNREAHRERGSSRQKTAARPKSQQSKKPAGIPIDFSETRPA